MLSESMTTAATAQRFFGAVSFEHSHRGHLSQEKSKSQHTITPE
jgi:hypothetical protein